MILTHDQMLMHWRRAQGLEPSRTDCTVEQFEGIDFTLQLATRMRQWYLDLLDFAPENLLSPRNMAASATVEATSPGVWRVTLPENVRRVFRVSLQDTIGPFPVIPFGGYEARHALTMAQNRYNRGCPAVPVVLGERNNLLIFNGTESQQPQPIMIICAVDPGDESYELDESALSKIPTLL